MAMSQLCPVPVDPFTVLFLLVVTVFMAAVSVVVAAGFITALVKLVKELRARG